MDIATTAKPIEEKIEQSIHSRLDFCDAVLVLLVPVLFFPKLYLFLALAAPCNCNFLARRERSKKGGRRGEGRKERRREGEREGGGWEKKGRREEGREGGREERNVTLFHVTCHYSLRNGKLTKWIKYNYCWSKHLQPIRKPCHFLSEFSCSSFRPLSPIQSVSHTHPDNYRRNEIITQQRA